MINWYLLGILGKFWGEREYVKEVELLLDSSIIVSKSRLQIVLYLLVQEILIISLKVGTSDYSISVSIVHYLQTTINFPSTLNVLLALVST